MPHLFLEKLEKKIPFRVTKRRVFLFVVLIIFLRLFFKEGTLFSSILLSQLTTIIPIIILSVFLISILVYFNIPSRGHIDISVVIAFFGILVPFVIFLAPSTVDYLINIENLQISARLNCDLATEIKEKAPEDMGTLTKHFDNSIFNENLSFVRNNFVNDTYPNLIWAIRDIEISNQIIDLASLKQVESDLQLTRQIVLMNQTLIDKAKLVASSTCEVLVPSFDEVGKLYARSSLFSAFVLLFKNIFYIFI